MDGGKGVLRSYSHLESADGDPKASTGAFSLYLK